MEKTVVLYSLISTVLPNIELQRVNFCRMEVTEMVAIFITERIRVKC